MKLSKFARAMKTIENKTHKVIRVSDTEFELENGDVYPIPFELDYTPTLEEFQEFIDDSSFSTSMSGGSMKWTVDYKSLNEGDTLIFTGKIYNVTYTSFMYNATIIYFDVENYTKMGVNSSEIAFLFEGNITDEYKIGDDVRITLTVKHFVYTNETSGASIDMEVFEEGWDQDKFIMSFFTQVLPESCIEKV